MNNHSSGGNEKMLNFIAETIELIRDQMATKDDLAQLEARMTSKLEVETTAIRGDIEQVQLRLGTVERAVSTRLGHVETEVSRIRSVVYLLVKDQPDLLRLLGQGQNP
ncbi:MAG TPA: hypothetical protein VFC61_11775 [Blastocatellia bacterium]|nr:hypothetical protein [Blastocatellia bacterium]